MFAKLEDGGIPAPPAGYVAPLGASRNTWTNIYKNKGRIDYCVQQFSVSFITPLYRAEIMRSTGGAGGTAEP